MTVRTDLVILSREIVANEGRVGARGATLELARGYLVLAEAYEFDVAIPLAEANDAMRDAASALNTVSDQRDEAERRLEQAEQALAQLAKAPVGLHGKVPAHTLKNEIAARCRIAGAALAARPAPAEAET